MPDAYTGKVGAISWIWTGGTVALDADYKSFTYTPSVQLVDQSRGADTTRRYLANLKDGQASLALINAVGGTIVVQSMVEGGSGTIIWGREGTVAGKPKYTLPCICQGAKISEPFDNVIEITCDFQQTGARVEGVY